MITVLLPTYEPNPEHLKEALNSLLKQTYSDWNLIIHDDASTADVKAMVQEFFQDDRISFQRCQKRLGIGGNWNACLKLAQSEFIQFLFQDDVWKPEYLEKAMEAMKSSDAIGLVGVNHEYSRESPQLTEDIYAEVHRARSQIPEGKQTGRDFLLTWAEAGLRPNIIGEPSFVMLRKSVTDRVGLFREDLKQGLDMEYWIRMLTRSDLYWISEELGSFRVHAKAASAQNQNAGAGLTDRLECFEVLMRELPDKTSRAKVKHSLKKALSGMITKFFQRKREGGGTGGMKKGTLLTFCLKHPFITLQAVLSAV